MDCPCHSGKPYEACCQVYHDDKELPDPVSLMRSRYAAYALGDVDYILATTHHHHPLHHAEKAAAKADLQRFSDITKFEGLEILDSSADEEEAFVTFKAVLTQHGHDATFVEKSRFLKV